MVEYLIVIQKVMGSIPISYPYMIWIYFETTYHNLQNILWSLNKKWLSVMDARGAHDPEDWFDSKTATVQGIDICIYFVFIS